MNADLLEPELLGYADNVINHWGLTEGGAACCCAMSTKRWILEEIDEYAEEREAYALVIADEPGQNSQQGEYRSDLSDYRQFGTRGWRHRRISRVVDTLHFAPSNSSRLVQASDLIAFLCHRISTKTDGDPRAIRANTRLWERLADRIHRVHVGGRSIDPRCTKTPHMGGV